MISLISIITKTFIVISSGFIMYKIGYHTPTPISDTEVNLIVNFLKAYNIDLSPYPQPVQMRCILLYKEVGIQSLEQIQQILRDNILLVQDNIADIPVQDNIAVGSIPDVPQRQMDRALIMSPDTINLLTESNELEDN